MRPTSGVASTLFLVWFLFISSTSFWLPAYDGTIVRGEMVVPLAGLYAFVGGLAWLFVRERVASVDHAMFSAIPALALLALAVIAGSLRNADAAGDRGATLHLYYGVALWGSWGALVLASAVLSRTRWGGRAGIALSLFVAVLGYVLFTARTD